MPFQAAVLRTLAPNRSHESFVAGGIGWNAHEPVRWSADVDVFYDAEDAVLRLSAGDIFTLEAAGYATRRDVWTPSFRRAWVCSKDSGSGPLLLLDQMRRHSRVNLAELREMGASLDAPAL